MNLKYIITKYFVYLLFYLTYNLYSVNSTFQPKQENSSTLPPCRACKIFIESFKKGLAKTANKYFDGGDTAWEEKNLKKYSLSELRLTEVEEQLCSDLHEGKNECYALWEEHDQDVENWFFFEQNVEEDLYDYLCIRKFKYCCPDNHYGSDCKPCDGFPDDVCSNNGKCRGSGTRKGNGTCNCNAGYTGIRCNECASSYYASYMDDNKTLCSKCHLSCKGNCSKSGPDGCEECKEGWFMDKEKGCTDINECAASKSPCNPRQFCVNNEGSYRCLDCDRSCEGCTGDGPDMCTKCAKGYILKDNVCIDEEQENRKQHVYLTRYLTYLGLVIATCIVFKNNTLLASIIGVAVGIFISVSEYMLNNVSTTPNAEDIAKTFLNT